MNCQAFIGRLYDDDARAAGRGRGGIPADMTDHMRTCDSCRAEYHAASADDLLLARALRDAPAPAWRAEVLRRISRSRRASWSLRIATANEALIWGILAIAASQVLPGERSMAAYVAAFCAGGTAAFVFPALATHWRVVRRPLSGV